MPGSKTNVRPKYIQTVWEVKLKKTQIQRTKVSFGGVLLNSHGRNEVHENDKNPQQIAGDCGAAFESWTRNLFITNELLYRLS